MSKCVHYVFFARKNEYIMQRKSKNLLIENKFDIVSQFPLDLTSLNLLNRA